MGHLRGVEDLACCRGPLWPNGPQPTVPWPSARETGSQAPWPSGRARTPGSGRRYCADLAHFPPGARPSPAGGPCTRCSQSAPSDGCPPSPASPALSPAVSAQRARSHAPRGPLLGAQPLPTGPATPPSAPGGPDPPPGPEREPGAPCRGVRTRAPQVPPSQIRAGRPIGSRRQGQGPLAPRLRAPRTEDPEVLAAGRRHSAPGAQGRRRPRKAP